MHLFHFKTSFKLLYQFVFTCSLHLVRAKSRQNGDFWRDFEKVAKGDRTVNFYPESYVVISDYGNHDKYAVIVFNNLVLESFYAKHPEFKVQEIEFQSDGTFQHFKQKYTIFSMTLSKLPAVWHFSATSHGEGCIDGIGRTIKPRVREASRARMTDPRTSLDFANAAKKICQGINILYETEQKIQAVKKNLDATWMVNGEEIKGMPGTRKSHCVRSCSPDVVFYSLTSDCKMGTLFNFRTGECIKKSISSAFEERSSEATMWPVGGSFKYDDREFHGLITDIENGQYQIKCLEPTKTEGMLKFEAEHHVVWYKREQIVSAAIAPTLVNSRGFYKI